MIRFAAINDIPRLQLVRNSVKENALSDPDRIRVADYEEYLFQKGKGWVYEWDQVIVGFAVVDCQDNNVWALFVHPDYEGRGIGNDLHREMLDWFFDTGKSTLWLSTAPQTRAEKFYRRRGWKETGIFGKGEIRFEMTASSWKEFKN